MACSIASHLRVPVSADVESSPEWRVRMTSNMANVFVCREATGLGPACPIFFSAHAKRPPTSSTSAMTAQGRHGDPTFQIKALLAFPGAYGEEVDDFLPEHERPPFCAKLDGQSQSSLHLP